MKNLLFLIVFTAGLFSSDLFAQTNQIRGVKNQLEQTRRAVLDKMPKAPQVLRIPITRVQKHNGKTSTIPVFKPRALGVNLPKSVLLEKKYQSVFVSLSKDPTATGDDYLQLYYTMGCDSQFPIIGSNLKLETVADKYLDIDTPTPERLAEVLAIARQQFPQQQYIGPLLTPSSLLLERATTRYYIQVLAADSTFTNRDAAILAQLYDEFRQGLNNDGNILYYYLTGLYEYAIPPLESYCEFFEKHSVSDRYINRHINEIAPRFHLLERCYDAMSFSEQRDSLLASPSFKRIIKFEKNR